MFGNDSQRITGSKVISFCLFGTAPKYFIGAVRNMALAKEFYPDWESVFWVDTACFLHNKVYINSLLELGATILPFKSSSSNKVTPDNINPMFWRFMVADWPWLDRFIVRDTDSRLSKREALAVEEWVKSGKPFHTMRDHPAHLRPINGGMWGAMGSALPHMASEVQGWAKKNPNRFWDYGADQEFLGQIIWPLVANNAMQHASVGRSDYGALPFPSKRDGKNFVGQVWELDEHWNDIPRDGDWQQIPDTE